MTSEDRAGYHARRYLEEIALGRAASCDGSRLAHLNLATLHRYALAAVMPPVAPPRRSPDGAVAQHPCA